jgi:transposase InsO family protein
VSREARQGRACSWLVICTPPLRAFGFGALGRLSGRGAYTGRRSDVNAPGRRVASRSAILRLAAYDVRAQRGRPSSQSRAGATADACDGDRGTGAAPRYEQGGAGHKIYSYLLRGMMITEPNHVWAADITYVPMAHGFLYLVAIIDWASRAVCAKEGLQIAVDPSRAHSARLAGNRRIIKHLRSGLYQVSDRLTPSGISKSAAL